MLIKDKLPAMKRPAAAPAAAAMKQPAAAADVEDFPHRVSVFMQLAMRAQNGVQLGARRLILEPVLGGFCRGYGANTPGWRRAPSGPRTP
jgi:hypothetical protein